MRVGTLGKVRPRNRESAEFWREITPVPSCGVGYGLDTVKELELSRDSTRSQDGLTRVMGNLSEMLFCE